MLDRKTSRARMIGALTGIALIAAASTGTARAQAALAPTTPAEIQPGHPPPPGAKTETPGGAARDGVITPPAPGADAAINRGAPAATSTTPVIPPPGSPGGNPTIVPK